MSRLDNIAAAGNPSDAQKYAQYTYLGASTIAKVAHPAVSGGLNLAYDPDGDDSFDGLDRFGRVVDQRWQNDTPTVKDQFKYGYDRASNRTWREVAPDGGNPTGLDEYYTYDGLHRLEKAERGTLAGSPYSSITSHTKRQDFGLEALGNWREFKDDAGDGSEWDLDQDRTHNAVNETTGITGGSWIVPGYDAAGNMLSGPKPTDPTVRQHYKWDAWNRMVAVYDDDSGEPGDLIAEYRYDMLNRRIAKIKPDAAHQGKYVRTDYYYTSKWQIAQTREDDNLDDKETLATTRKYEYVWDVRYIDAPVCRDADKNADNDCTDAATGIQGSNSGDEHLYYCQDANFNVTAIVDVYDGAVVERYAYDPYGKPTILNGVRDSTGTSTTEWQTRSSNTFANAILYCGYYFDDESGLYHVRNRYYHTQLGRWASRDPIGYVDGMNAYGFMASTPTAGSDPYGLEALPPGLTQEQLDAKIELAKNKAWWYRNFGTDLASRFLTHFGEGTGGTYELKDGDIKKIVGTEQAKAKMGEAVDEFKAYLAKADLSPAQKDFDYTTKTYMITYNKPSTKLDRSAEADLFYSFHNLYFEAEFDGKAWCVTEKKFWKGDVTFKFHDSYRVAPRAWKAIPGDNEATDYIFWLWQEYGDAKAFKVKGDHKVKDQSYTVVTGGGDVAPP